MGCGCGKTKEQKQAEAQAKHEKRLAMREARRLELAARGVRPPRQ